MGLLPMDMEILPPSDDRVFKLILTKPEAKSALIDLISAILGRNVVDVEIRNNEVPPENVDEKAERLDINCKIDDGSQVDLDAGEPYSGTFRQAAQEPERKDRLLPL